MENRFQILSIDGGGIKGVFSAALLAKLEEDLETKIVDHFDLIVGTSTGGIIALGLATGLTPKEMVEFYFNKGPEIFKRIPLITNLKNIFFSKYSGHNLENILKDEKVFGDKLLGHCNKRVVIPSYDIDSSDVHVFKTAHHKRFTRDFKVPIWKVAQATCAAPVFLPISESVDNIRLIDGGVWANNPTMVGLVEALSILEIPLCNIRILSIGTTEDLKNSPKHLSTFGGWVPWAKTAVELILQAQSVSINSQVSLILKENYERVNPKVPKGLFKLDKINMKELYAFASKHSRTFSPKFEAKFKEYRAKEFIPENKF